jgi:hypothetical protein
MPHMLRACRVARHSITPKLDQIITGSRHLAGKLLLPDAPQLRLADAELVIDAERAHVAAADLCARLRPAHMLRSLGCRSLGCKQRAVQRPFDVGPLEQRCRNAM